MGLLRPGRIVGHIDDHVDEHLGILHRREARETYQIVLVLSGQALGGSRLAAHLVTGHRSGAAGTIFHGLKHSLFQEIGGRLGNGFPNQHRLLALHNGALFI